LQTVVGISGASGAILGVRLVEKMLKQGIETHLIISKGGQKTISLEMEIKPEDVAKIASFSYLSENSEITKELTGVNLMIIVPCSMKTLSGIAWGRTDNLILKVANMILEKKRKLILLVRESPWHMIHISNMLRVAEKGGIIMPPTVGASNIIEINDYIEDILDRVFKGI